MRTLKALVVLAQNGERHKVGSVFQRSDEDAKLLVDCQMAEDITNVKVEDVAGGESGELPDWPVEGMSPDEYLAKFPEGPHATLAKRYQALLAE